MTKKEFIKKYIYGIGNDALTDNQEAIDMAKDLDRYFTEQLRKHAVMCEFHCERFNFGRDKKCEQQCSDCHWMQIKSQ